MRSRRLPIGAEPIPSGGVHFRVWAPDRTQVEVVLEGGGATPLTREPTGYFSGRARSASPGALYRFRLDGTGPYPDPASRFQPEGPHGPSQVIDPDSFRWTDRRWRGITLAGQILYEMHVGTFTPEGTWRGAAGQLARLAALGITALEIMPVADFPGRFGWGYDGVDLFAPTRLYGSPDDFRRFVDQAHALGLGVLLDVVYNHFGPDGNYLGRFSPHYVTPQVRSDWGDAINFDGPRSGPVREFFLANAKHWIDEFHLDGLRFDATQCMWDRSREHILKALARAARAAAGRRSVVLIAETESQETRLIRPGGHGLDAAWNDDFHHSAMVALTGRRDGYYAGYRGTPDDLIATATTGFLYQGQWFRSKTPPRKARTRGLPAAAFVNFLQNHDQIPNTSGGRRGHTMASRDRFRALTALLLLSPGTPMLFQGQEFFASTPFHFFADHRGALADSVRHGRRTFLKTFPRWRDQTDPCSAATFRRSILKPEERRRHALVRELIRLRRDDPAFRSSRVRGEKLGPRALALRFFGAGGDDRLLVVNLGPRLRFVPPRDTAWEVLWTSRPGVKAMEIPGSAAVVYRAKRRTP